MENKKGHPASEQKIELMTEIITSIMKAKMTFVKACELLAIEKIEEGSLTKKRTSENYNSLFFYSHVVSYLDFVKNLYAKYFKTRGIKLRKAVNANVGIVAKRKENSAFVLPNKIVNGVFVFDKTQTFPVEPFYFKLGNKKQREGRYLNIGASSGDYFKNIHPTRLLGGEYYDAELSQKDCLEGMGTLFKIFTTEKLGRIYISEDVFLQKKEEFFKEMTAISRNSTASIDPNKIKLTKEIVRPILKELIEDIKKLFVDKDKGKKPEIFVDKEIIKTIVEAAFKTKNLDFLRKREAWDAVYKMKKLPKEEEFLERVKKMNYQYFLREEFYNANTVLPGFTVYIPVYKGKRPNYNGLNLAFHRLNYLLMNKNDGWAEETKTCMSFERSWVKEKIRDVNPGFLLNTVEITSFLKDFNLDTLRKIKKDILIAEEGANTIFRFFAATQKICAVQLLLNNI